MRLGEPRMNDTLTLRPIDRLTSRSRRRHARAIAAALVLLAAFLGQAARAQQVADPGFHSVGRGAPLAAALPTVPYSKNPKLSPLDRIIESFPEFFAG